MADDYTYNATDDGIANWCAAFTSREGDGSGDFEQVYLDALTAAAACKADGAFLDVGSGLGRVIDLIKPYPRNTIGLEPDAERFRACHHHFRNDDHIDILNITTGELREQRPQARFDVVTVSMVVQHVSTQTCRYILSDVRELLAPGGVGIVATTHFFEERFTYQNEQSAHDVGEYDRYAENIRGQVHGIPVRMFSKASFLREIEQAGLETIVWQQFSYVRPERLANVAALFYTPPEQFENFAISQYALVRRANR